MVKPRCWAKSRLARIEHRCDAGQALQNRRFEIVDHDFGRHAQGREGMLVAGEEVLHGLGDRELHEHLPAKSQDHNEERRPATGIGHRDGSIATPINLRTLAASEVELQINRSSEGTNAADVTPQDRHATAVTLLAQTLENLPRTVRMSVEQPRDPRFEGIKNASLTSSWPVGIGARRLGLPRLCC